LLESQVDETRAGHFNVADQRVRRHKVNGLLDVAGNLLGERARVGFRSAGLRDGSGKPEREGCGVVAVRLDLRAFDLDGWQLYARQLTRFLERRHRFLDDICNLGAYHSPTPLAGRRRSLTARKRSAGARFRTHADGALFRAPSLDWKARRFHPPAP